MADSVSSPSTGVAEPVVAESVVAVVTTLIFDVDDTLYDAATGFTDHRTGEAVQQFMVDYLNFPDRASAQRVRDEYFARYHATAKALIVAEQEGQLPPPDPNGKPIKSPRFDTNDLAEYWATKLDFDLLGGPKTQFRQDLLECNLTMVAFSNGPRKYVKRVLKELGLFDIFGEERLFAVDDVLPYCKPEREAFEKIFHFLNVKAEECVMIEDSMKNIRRAKELGVKTVLVTGADRMPKSHATATTAVSPVGASTATNQAEVTNPSDAPVADDPAVDVAIETVDEMRNALPGLWETPAMFAPFRAGR
jgi:putative hydrolase of the HAD superfamily